MSVRVPGGFNPAAVVITGGTSKWDDGAPATPSIAFASQPTMGFYRATTDTIGLSNTTEYLRFALSGGGSLNLGGMALNWGTSSSSSDTQLARGSAGVIKFGSANSFSANGSVATTMTSLGPTGSHTTIQTWLTIQDSGGTVRYIPCY